jgi:entericidin B
MAFGTSHNRLLPLLLLALLVLAVSSLTACNTVAGAGQDVSAAGRAVTKGADKVKDGM